MIGGARGAILRAMADAPDAWDQALAFLARRAYTLAEIERKLSQKGHPSGVIAEVLGRLRELRLVDEGTLAYNHAARRAEEGRHGPDRVRRELLARGLSRSIVDEAMRQAFPSEDGDAPLVAAILRLTRGSGVPEDPASRARLARRLLRAGFRRSQVMRLTGGGGGGGFGDLTEDDDDALS